MKKILFFSLLLLTLAACQKAATDTTEVAVEGAPVQTVADTESDRAAIAQITQTWQASARAGDHAAIAALYADDAVILPGDEPLVRGRQALDAYFTANYSEPSELTVQTVEIVVAPSGGFAYEIGTSTSPLGAGKYMTVYSNASGHWEIVGDSWSNDAPATAAD